ncbi:MAG: coenzyme F420-0:L-glutamate ligase [Xanthobacteraceae bacterium]|nr:coenzyme F420-0:L-glutamate ligase [Xanthobacteraceae bacterium]MBX3533449.1 coenzyme F420-0:L-glutamate ligase [Xanthobacteraceae bacterium]MCW5676389.1 coenzyme F420-0:L-glutamate ligase [Xanthobacteraceae bacterium]
MNATANDAKRISLISLPGIPLVKKGDDLVALILDGVNAAGERLSNGDIVVLAQKIVSKAQGRQVSLDSIKASVKAIDLATKCDKDPRLVELILQESSEVLRVRPGVIVVAHRLGFVLANAGIDRSNVDDDNSVLLLPEDPDSTARQLRDAIKRETGSDIGIIINDSLGRAWRNGTIGTALGVSGVSALADLRGVLDMFGRPLQTTEVGHADEIAAAASLLMGQSDQRRPIILVKGVGYSSANGSASDLVRDRKLDLFR